MNRLIITASLLLIGWVVSAQEYGLYQMRDVWNASHLNPGFFPRQEFIVSLPSVHTSLNAIGINQERLFEYNSAENTNYLNLDGVVGELERDLVLKNSTIIDGLGVGGRVGNFFVTLSTSSVVDAEFALPEALLQTVWEGTEQYLDQPLNIGPSVDMIAYQKIGLGLNYEVNPRLAVGLRINRLLGAGSFVTNRSGLTLTQSSDIYQTTAELDYEAFYYGAGQFNLLDQTIEGFENFGDALDTDGVEPEGGSGLRRFTNGNTGWSFDLGAEYLMGDRLTLSASLLNLGSIRWKNATQQVNLTGTVNFEGVDAANLDDGEDFEVVPGIDTAGTFEATSNVAYTQALAPRTYLGANYQLFPFWDVGGLLYNEFFTGGTFTALSLSTRFSLGRILSIGGVYTLQNGTFNSLGANAALKLGPLQVYAIADNLSSVTNEERLDGINFRTGLNLTFGRKKSDLRLAAARGLDAEMPDPVNVPAAPQPAEAPEADEPEGPAGNTVTETPEVAPALDAGEVIADDEVTTAEPEPESMETTTDNPEPLAQPAQAPLRASPNEERSYPENHPANAEGLKLFPFQLELRDKKDLGLVEEASVDVYRIEKGGYYKLIQTEEAFGGRINMQLSAERAPYQAVVKSTGYDSLIVDFQPERKSSLNQVVFLVAAEEEVSNDVTASDAPNAPESSETPEPEMEEPSPVNDNSVPASETADPEEMDTSASEPLPEAAPITKSAPDTELPANEPEPPVADEMETVDPAPEVAEREPPASYVTYLLTQRTSLREAPASDSRVISRMPVDTELKLLEKTNELWWKVSMGGWEGYVKAALLKLRD
jgi:hypothetical protein